MVLPITLPSVLTSGAIDRARSRLSRSAAAWTGPWRPGAGRHHPRVGWRSAAQSSGYPWQRSRGSSSRLQDLDLVTRAEPKRSGSSRSSPPSHSSRPISAILYAVCQAEQRFVAISAAGFAGSATTLATMLLLWDYPGSARARCRQPDRPDRGLGDSSGRYDPRCARSTARTATAWPTRAVRAPRRTPYGRSGRSSAECGRRSGRRLAPRPWVGQRAALRGRPGSRPDRRHRASLGFGDLPGARAVHARRWSSDALALDSRSGPYASRRRSSCPWRC